MLRHNHNPQHLPTYAMSRDESQSALGSNAASFEREREEIILPSIMRFIYHGLDAFLLMCLAKKCQMRQECPSPSSLHNVGLIFKMIIAAFVGESGAAADAIVMPMRKPPPPAAAEFHVVLAASLLRLCFGLDVS